MDVEIQKGGPPPGGGGGNWVYCNIPQLAYKLDLNNNIHIQKAFGLKKARPKI